MTRTCLLALCLALSLGPWSALAQTIFRAERLRISGCELSATELRVWPCACVPLGFGASRARWTGDTVLSLERPRILLGPVSLPFAPQWWLVWGARVGLLLPQIALREGLSVGPGVHLPLGRARSSDLWLLGRGDGVELSAEVRHRAELFSLRARVSELSQGVSARGTQSVAHGGTVLALRADGATDARLGALFARSASEALRVAHEAQVGASHQSAGVMATALEFTRLGRDAGARMVFSVAGPTLHRGASTVSLRAYAGSSLSRAASVFADAELRARSAENLGPMVIDAEARAEGSRGERREAWLTRALTHASLPLRRRFGALSHTLGPSLGAGVETGSSGPRGALMAGLQSELGGARWRWLARGTLILSSDAALAPRSELRSVLSSRWLSAEAGVTHDAGFALADGALRLRDLRGDSLALAWAYRSPSLWDLRPSWEAQGQGPMDLQGVRGRRVLGHTARAELSLALGRGLRLRAEAVINVLSASVAAADLELGWRAACGCAGLSLSGLFTELAGHTLSLAFNSGQ